MKHDIPQDRVSLARNPDFTRLWVGQTVSVFGSLITRTALPFTAVLFLRATPLQMAWLAAADLIAGFAVGLVAGVWVDRLPRRPLLIATDIARALLVLLVPLAAWLGWLRVELLYAVAVLTGALSTLFEIAYTSYLPTLIEKDQLLEGNGKLTATASAAEFFAFGISGWLVQLLSAPFALVIDAATFVVSAVSLALIRKEETPPGARGATHDPDAAPPESFWREASAGLRLVATHPELRALALGQWALEWGMSVFGTVFLLYTTRTLLLAPGVQGMIFALGGLTSLVGAAFAERIARRYGLGRSLVVALLVVVAGAIAVPLAPDASLFGIALLVVNQVLTDPAWTVYEIGHTTLRQTLADDHLQGRVNATFRAGGLLAMLAGTFLGGWLGERIGLRETLYAGIALASLAPVLLSRVAGRRSQS
jgi:MFS family permease